MSRPSEARKQRGDAGTTLVEVLISLTLMAVVVASVLPALIGDIRLSRISKDQAKIEAVLGSAVDRMSNAGWRPLSDTDATGYEPKAREGATTVGWPATTVAVLLIRYWDTSTKSWSNTNPVEAAGSCGSAVTSVTGEATLQLVTVRVTSPDGKLTRQLDVIMGDLRSVAALDASA